MFTVNLPITITASDFESIVVTAVESGSYGSFQFPDRDQLVSNEDAQSIADEHGVSIDVESARLPYSTRLALTLLAGGSVPVTDRYGDGSKGVLTAQNIIDAIQQRITKGFLASRGHFDVGDIDVLAADAIFQTAAFGGLVYA